MRNLYRWATRSLLQNGAIAEIDSIRISQIDKQEDFFDTIAGALELIRTTDPKRYSRVTWRLEWIASQKLDFAEGRYLHWNRTCLIDFVVLRFRDPEYTKAYYAKVIIHEATHRYLLDRRIPYDESTRVRVKAICVAEENRWLKIYSKTNPECYRMLRSKFNPLDWTYSWHASESVKCRNRLKLAFGKSLT